MLSRVISLLLLAAVLSSSAVYAGVCEEWNLLYSQIRDFPQDPAAARSEFIRLHRQLREEYGKKGIGGRERYYPVVGYDPSWGEEGKAYRPRGYRFFTGNPQGIHPSLDLFILDRDQDCRDDHNGETVPIIAFNGGVVVGLNTAWEPTSAQRGGQYLWIYDPTTDRYTYYAHLARIDVHLGQIVSAGDQLGILGRTGRNAYKRRSPTHLHLMVLNFSDGEMRPYNPWHELLRARTTHLPQRVAAHGER